MKTNREKLLEHMLATARLALPLCALLDNDAKDNEFKLLAAGVRFDYVELKAELVLSDDEFAAKYFDVETAKKTLSIVYHTNVDIISNIITKYNIPKSDDSQLLEILDEYAFAPEVNFLLNRARFTSLDKILRGYISEIHNHKTPIQDDLMVELRNVYDNMYTAFQTAIENIPEEYYENV